MSDRTSDLGESADLGSHARRRVLLVEGVRWEVRLFTSRYDRRGRPDLLFESDGVVRRVRNYPSDWHALPDDALFAISAGR